MKEFQTWYNSLPGGKPINVDGKWGPTTEAAYKAAAPQYLSATGKNTVPGLGGVSIPNQGYSSYTELSPTIGPNGKVLDLQTKQGTIPGRFNTSGTIAPLPTRMFTMNTSVPGGVDPITGAKQPDLMYATPGPGMSSSRDAFNKAAVSMVTQNVATNAPAGSVSNKGYQTPFTIGDAMQGVDVLSKFGMLIGGPEKEQVYPDATTISKSAYDPRPALYQNQRNLTNQMAGLDTGNINLRRNMYNQGYASKLNADNQTLAQYQQMNNQATTEYENRLSNQRRYNVGQRTYTDNINAANRGQYMNTVQNAFTSLGNYGQAMNQKVVANDTINIYGKLFPNTSQGVIDALAYEDYMKLRNKKQTTNGQ